MVGPGIISKCTVTRPEVLKGPKVWCRDPYFWVEVVAPMAPALVTSLIQSILLGLLVVVKLWLFYRWDWWE